MDTPLSASTRRDFLKASAALTAGAALSSTALAGCSSPAPGYRDAVRATWRHADPAPAGVQAVQRELVRYATLAPSSHNTQCWRYRLGDRALTIEPDLSRRCAVADPDDHHVFATLGCAAENVVHAARAYGLDADVAFDGATGHVRVALESGPTARTDLFEAIVRRQSTRGAYDGQPLAADDLGRLERTGSDGVGVILVTDRGQMEQVLEYVVAGNAAQVGDPAFVAELKHWIRFNEADAVRTGDGLFTRCSGNPTSPRWLGGFLFDRFLDAEKENEKVAAQLRSSAGLAVFVSEADDPAHWVDAGRCYERFALRGTVLDVRNAMLNQPTEVADLRPQLANYLGVGPRRVDLLVRFGRGPDMPRSLRRPLDDVLLPVAP